MKRHGFIFIQALMVVAVLVALLAMLAADQRASLQNVHNRLCARRADEAAKAAVARAMSVVAEAETQDVTRNDDWAQLGNNGAKEFDLPGATFRVEVIDAGSRININTATQAQLLQLPLTPEQVGALLDWREAGEQARADGAKDAFYNSLSPPYNARLGPLLTMDELLMVRDWTAQTLYQPPTTSAAGSAPLPEDSQGSTLPLASLLTVDSSVPNKGTDGSSLINFGQAGVDPASFAPLGIGPDLAQQFAAGAPYKSFAQLFAAPGMTPQIEQTLLDAATFSADQRVTGKINLNTATDSVLETLPNMTPALAQAIIDQQGDGFQRLSQLATLPGMTPARLALLADDFTVGSDTWIVHAYGECAGVGAALEVVVRQTHGQVQVVDWDRINTTGIPAWWDWPAQVERRRRCGRCAVTKQTNPPLLLEWTPRWVRVNNIAAGASGEAARLPEMAALLSGHRQVLVGIGRSHVFLKTVPAAESAVR